ncbi:tetratricopeptide repeat protein [Reichenbachiella versicolor]|uniref:tetratricopeptide repeat protein n=1 Tax=Reichenbachiella versicolor TaxID=1821036 RepID=UPI001C876071|nr:tetratricopeptide repeat protein [Reichenbachiella versicolor]
MLFFLTANIALSQPAEKLYQQGNQAVLLGEYSKALAFYAKANALDDTNCSYLFGMGQTKEFLNDDLLALEDYNAALRINPHYVIAQYKRALIYFRRGNYKQSINDLTYLINSTKVFEFEELVFRGIQYKGYEIENARVISLNELLADMYDHRAKCYSKLGFRTPALLDYNKAIEFNDNDANYYVNRAQFELDSGFEAWAELDLRKAIAINPSHKPALKSLKVLVTKQERTEIDSRLYGEGNNATAYSEKANDFTQKGEFQSALFYFDSALNIRPDNAKDLMNRGVVKLKLGEPIEAIKDFKKSVFYDNSLTKNFILAGNSYQFIGNYQYAIEFYKKYLDNVGPDAGVYYNLGLAYMKFQNNDEACQTFKKAIKLGDKRAEKPMNDVCF